MRVAPVGISRVGRPEKILDTNWLSNNSPGSERKHYPFILMYNPKHRRAVIKIDEYEYAHKHYQRDPDCLSCRYFKSLLEYMTSDLGRESTVKVFAKHILEDHEPEG